MSHQLINFNIPTGLKDSLDEIAKAKCLSRTAIINQLLETYCRTELQHVAAIYPSNRQHPSNMDLEDDSTPIMPIMVDHHQFDGGWSL